MKQSLPKEAADSRERVRSPQGLARSLGTGTRPECGEQLGNQGIPEPGGELQREWPRPNPYTLLGELKQHLGATMGRRKEGEDIPLFCPGVGQMSTLQPFYGRNKH